MSKIRSQSLPEGLPNCLLSEPDGFKVLCDLLEINSRSEKQEIHGYLLKKIFKPLGIRKNKSQKTAVRLKQNITYAFSDPRIRIVFWRQFHDRSNELTKTSVRKSISLEYFALRNYDEKFYDLKVDEEKLKSCNEYFEFDSSQEKWKTPALTLLPSVHADFLGWQALAPERQTQTILAAFSIATLLDDARLLHWATATIPELKGELNFLFEDVSVEANDKIDVVLELQNICEKLSDAVSELMKGTYTTELFTLISSHVEELTRLRDPVFKAITTNTLENFFHELGELFEHQSNSVPWLATLVGDVKSKWREFYLVEKKGEMDVDLIEEDIRDSLQKVEKRLKKWHVAYLELENSEASLTEFENHQTPSEKDVVEQLKYSKRKIRYFGTYTESMKKELKLRHKLIDSAYPCEHEYSQKVDAPRDTESQKPTSRLEKSDVSDAKELHDETTKSELDTADVVIEMQRYCDRLSDAVAKLNSGTYSKKLFDQITTYGEEISRLRGPVMKATAINGVENLIVEFSGFIDRQSDQAPWLAALASVIKLKWRETLLSRKETDFDLDRIKKGFKDRRKKILKHLKKWGVASSELERNKTLLREIEHQLPPSIDDIVAQLEYEEQKQLRLESVNSSSKKVLKQKRKLIEAVYPSKDKIVPVVKIPKVPDSEKPTPPIVHPDPIDVEIPQDASQTELNLLIWDAVRDGKLGLAYHVARLIPIVKNLRVSNMSPNPDLLAAIAYGRLVQGPGGQATQEFLDHAKSALTKIKYYDEVTPAIRDVLSLLLFSASLRPALFVPETNATTMLQKVELSGELTMVNQLARAVTEHGQKLLNIDFDVPQLKSILNFTFWEKRLKTIKKKVDEWFELAARVRFNSATASKIWKYWVTNDGVLVELTHLISNGLEASVPRVEKIIEDFTNKDKFENLVEITRRNDVTLNKSKINRHVLGQLNNHSNEPISLGRNWLRLVESKPRNRGYVEEIVSNLHTAIKVLEPKALKEIADFQQRLELKSREGIAEIQEKILNKSLGTALVQAETSIKDFASIFKRDESYSEKDNAYEIRRVLLREILYVSSLEIKTDGSFGNQLEPADVLDKLTDPNLYEQSIVGAFTARLNRGDLSGAQFTCNEITYKKLKEADQCKKRLDEAFTKMQMQLVNKLDELSEKLEQAFNVGEFSVNELETLNGEIVFVRDLCDNKKSIFKASERISEIRAKIEEKFDAGLSSLLRKLQIYLPLDNPSEQVLVEDAIESEDLITLHDQYDRLKNGEQLLPLRTERYKTFETFLSKVEIIDEFLDTNSKKSSDQFVNSVVEFANVLRAEFPSQTSLHKERTARLLKLWYAMERDNDTNIKLTSDFLDCIGFSVKYCEIRNYNSLRVSTEPLRNRELCPVSAFGSDANGDYDLILNWRSPPQDYIVQLVGEKLNRSMIVLHFGRLGPSREWLANWSVQSGNQFIVIDESLIIYLASLQSGNLRALFDCTLPFSCVQPFFTAAGSVPPESFYGREEERQTLIDRWGSCFVYGGRQLGKTALLRSVEASFNRPKAHQIAIFIDLRVQDVGIAYEAEFIWSVLWTNFKNCDIIPANRKKPTSRDKLVETLTDCLIFWFLEFKDSRILLLLDEADAFLTSDLQNDFRESTRLKGLMDETNRAFKVVFSGLHNVLRTTERANHPLAHFGEPICVGPLLSNGESVRASALLREPLAAVGCRFEKNGFSTHVLGWTNYYPSLIQLYGSELVKYLRESAGRDVPYVITKNDIKLMFSRDGIRDPIRRRFSLTLQLDSRYEVIAYAIVLELLGDKQRLTQGLSPFEILELSRDWWEEGFELNQHEFNALLDEMCGLGVLRKHRIQGSGPNYTIRNPNVLLLLGDQKYIEEALGKEHQLSPTFEPSAYHAQYPNDRSTSPRRGPLSYEQESKLRRSGGVAVISGTAAVNIGDVGVFLSQRMDSGTFRVLELCTDEFGLEKQLTKLRPDKFVHIYMVPTEEKWSMRWIKRASEVLKRVKRGKFMRIIFLADPEQLWSFARHLPDEYLEKSNELFEWFNILPWAQTFLRQWSSDQSFQVDKKKVEGLLELTGGWPCVLERHAEFRDKNWEETNQATVNYIAKNRAELRTKLGLSSLKAQQELAELQEYNAFTTEEVRIAVDMINEIKGTNYDHDILVRRLWWSKQLGLIQDIRGTWKLNSLLMQISLKE